MVEILEKITPILFLMVLGKVFRQTGILEAATVGNLKRFVIGVTLPLVLFLAFLGSGFDVRYLGLGAVIFGACLFLFFLGLGIRIAVRSDNPFLPVSFTTFENGLVGYAIVLVAFGQAEFYRIAVLDLGHILFFFSVTMTYIQVKSGGVPSLVRVVRSVLTSPAILGVAAGILLNAAGLAVPLEHNGLVGPLLETARSLAGLTVPLICLAIGFDLELDLGGLWRPAVLAVARFAAAMAAAGLIHLFVLEGLLHLDKTFSACLFIMFSLPPAFATGVAIPGGPDGRQKLALGVISVNLVLTFVSVPVWLWLFR